jgi:hypothetical protein
MMTVVTGVEGVGEPVAMGSDPGPLEGNSP